MACSRRSPPIFRRLCRKRLDLIELMPTPAVFAPLPAEDLAPLKQPFGWLLYATDRSPQSQIPGRHDTDNEVQARSNESTFYANGRGHVLRLGKATLKTGDEPIDWADARRIGLLKNRTDKYSLTVSQIEEFGVLDRSYHPFRMPRLGGFAQHRCALRGDHQQQARVVGTERHLPLRPRL